MQKGSNRKRQKVGDNFPGSGKMYRIFKRNTLKTLQRKGFIVYAAFSFFYFAVKNRRKKTKITYIVNFKLKNRKIRAACKRSYIEIESSW